MKRVQPSSANTVSPTCTTYRPKYQTMEKFLEYKASSPLDLTDLQVYISSQLQPDLQGSGNPSEQAAAQQRLTTNLGKLAIAEQTVADMTKCIQQDILAQQRYSGKIYSLQQEIQTAQAEVDGMEQTASEAKERAQLLDNPYSKTTRWETWFPLGRPLEKNSLPVLLSISLLFLVLSLGMFLRLADIELKLHFFERSSGVGYLSGYGLGR